MSAALFDWLDRVTWLAEVPRYASAILTRQVQAKISRSRPECWSDNFAWLPAENGEERFLTAFANHYGRIRAFHGCRPADLKSYFDYGLHGQTAEILETQFLSIFRDLPEQKLREALAELKDRKESERGRFWVVLEERELIEHCGHYLIQGSEYLMALAASLCRLAPGEDYRMRLRKHGTPTIFELHIPIQHLQEAQVDALARLVLAAWGELVSNRPLGMGHSPCLVVRRTVEPQYFVGHTHPARIRDPHLGHTIYVNQHTRCVHCAEARIDT